MKDHSSDEEIIDYLKYYANGNVKLKDNGAIEFVDKYYIPKKDEVLFVPSFISSIYPAPVSDDSYPGDKEFENAHILTSIQKNDLEALGNECFCDCNFEEFTIPSHIKKIENKCYNKKRVR